MTFDELKPSLIVNKVFINVKNLDYKEVCQKLVKCELTFDKCIVAINSNFGHSTLDGHESHITKPKLKKERRRKVIGDGTTFNSSIEFKIFDEDLMIRLLRYYPRSGQIQIIGCEYDQLLVDRLISFLNNSGLEEFSLVKFESGPDTILRNYKFTIGIEEKKYINIENLAYKLQNNEDIRNNSPFPIKYIKCCPSDNHYKIAIVFEGKRVHIWKNSGKVNILGTKTELGASLIYDFLDEIFYFYANELICNMPTIDEILNKII
jgi:hypothetical protein